MKWNFKNTYNSLPTSLFTKQKPTTVENPELVIANTELINNLGLEKFDAEVDLAILSGNIIAAGSEPIAQAYSGHQFGHFNTLGDGRAVLLGEHQDNKNNKYDIQLKGSGPTPYSRRGDGRAALGPMLREYIISEAMHALNIPTTRSLAVVATGQAIYRETILQGAILTRVAESHIRVGTFQYAASLNNIEVLKKLTDYTIQRHFSEINETANPYVELIKSVCDKQALLISKWLHVGFIHGVMNTDNMSIAGETIDYGPCAFMDVYNPETVFSSIDQNGRYAYKNQAEMAHWNLYRFAESLLPLLNENIEVAKTMAEDALNTFSTNVEKYWLNGMLQKLGLNNEPSSKELINNLLKLMTELEADYTNTLRGLCEVELPINNFFKNESFLIWHKQWTTQLLKQNEPILDILTKMKRVNPAIIARNHLVEEALAEAGTGHFLKLHRLLRAISKPFDDLPEFDDFKITPATENNYKTFCGT